MAFVSKQDAQRDLLEQKTQLGRWLFSQLTTFSKDEFVFMVKHAEADQSLSAFKRRIAKARELYQKIGEQCTQKQAAYIDKPFFYKISYTVGHRQQQDLDGEEEKIPCAILQYELDSFTNEQVEVTTKIPTNEHFRAFCNVISDVLQSNSTLSSRHKELQEALVAEQEEAKSLLESHREMFNQFLAKNLIVGKHLAPTAVTLPRPRRTSSVDEAESELMLHTPRKSNGKDVKTGKTKPSISLSTAADHAKEAALTHIKEKVGATDVPGGTKNALDRVDDQLARASRRKHQQP